MGFSFAAAPSLVDDHQINSLEETRYLQDTEIEDFCNLIRQHGGTIAAADPDDPAIPNPGILVPNCA